jgi:FKBP-type peptidyl-prolyl cis-trans isomerase
LKRVSLLLVAGLMALSVLGVMGCTSEPESPTEAPVESAPPVTEETTPAEQAEPVTELKIEDVKEGKGEAAVAGDSLTVHYTGWLTDGTEFDSSKNSGQPFPFTLGAGQVIPGWDQGVAGMKVGGVRKLTIPPDLAYGAGGTPDGTIPPNATLVFEVEIVSIDKP